MVLRLPCAKGMLHEAHAYALQCMCTPYTPQVQHGAHVMSIRRDPMYVHSIYSTGAAWCTCDGHSQRPNLCAPCTPQVQHGAHGARVAFASS
eukprot:154011-Pelagomonas_calceolata.AAC.2